jgi:hypothetical protein
VLIISKWLWHNSKLTYLLDFLMWHFCGRSCQLWRGRFCQLWHGRSCQLWRLLSTEWGETTPLFIELLDFNVGLFHQGPNGAVIIYISLGPALWPTDLTWWLISLGRAEAGGDFNFSLFHQGPNGAVITYVESDPAPCPTDWTRAALSEESWAAAVFRGKHWQGGWPHKFEAVAAVLLKGDC